MHRNQVFEVLKTNIFEANVPCSMFFNVLLCSQCWGEPEALQQSEACLEIGWSNLISFMSQIRSVLRNILHL